MPPCFVVGAHVVDPGQIILAANQHKREVCCMQPGEKGTSHRRGGDDKPIDRSAADHIGIAIGRQVGRRGQHKAVRVVARTGW